MKHTYLLTQSGNGCPVGATAESIRQTAGKRCGRSSIGSAAFTNRIQGWPLRSALLGALPALAVVFLGAGVASAHQTPVHASITRAAYNRASLLKKFLAEHNGSLRCMTSKSSLFETMKGIGEPGPDLDPEEIQLNNPLLAARPSPMTVLAAGAVFEDAWPLFCNHFYSPAEANPALHVGGLGQPVQDLYCGNARPVDARAWMMSGGNPYNWPNAHSELALGFLAASPQERARHLYSCFLKLGGVVHLIQDASQPSHTRNDAHGKCFTPGLVSQLECWEIRGAEGRSYCDHLCSGTHPVSTDAATKPEEALTRLAEYSSANFYSDDTFNGAPQIPYISSSGYMMHGDVPVGFIWPKGGPSLLDPKTMILKAQVDALLPRAVIASAEALNYFFRFRLQMATALVRMGDRTKVVLSVKNISRAAGVPEDALMMDRPGDASCIAVAELAGGQRVPLGRLRVTSGQAIFGPGQILTLEGEVGNEATKGLRFVVLVVQGNSDDGGKAIAVAESGPRAMSESETHIVFTEPLPESVGGGETIECRAGLTVKDPLTGKWVAPAWDGPFSAEVYLNYSYVEKDPRAPWPDHLPRARLGLLPVLSHRPAMYRSLPTHIATIGFGPRVVSFNDPRHRVSGECLESAPIAFPLPKCACNIQDAPRFQVVFEATRGLRACSGSAFTKVSGSLPGECYP